MQGEKEYVLKKSTMKPYSLNVSINLVYIAQSESFFGRQHEHRNSDGGPLKLARWDEKGHSHCRVSEISSTRLEAAMIEMGCGRNRNGDSEEKLGKLTGMPMKDFSAWLTSPFFADIVTVSSGKFAEEVESKG